VAVPYPAVLLFTMEISCKVFKDGLIRLKTAQLERSIANPMNDDFIRSLASLTLPGLAIERDILHAGDD